MIRNEKGVILVVVMMVMTLMSIIWGHTALLAMLELKKVNNHINNVKALYLAEMGVNFATVTLAFTDTNVITYDSSSLLGAHTTGTIIVTPDSVDPDLATIVSTATHYFATEVVEVPVKRIYPTFGGVRGALTANGPTLTNGEISIDGRDHDINGNLIPGTGGPGLVTGDVYTQSGSSLVGGTFEETDFAPSTPAESTVIEENVADLAMTPDEVLGFNEGALKRLAMQGIGGGQYVTNPDDLVGPLSGVTYIELDPEEPWWMIAGDPILNDGTGVLVVHNSTTTAIMKNLNEGSTFRGLIIADDIVHIHNEIIGAVVNLTPNPSEGNAIGNGSGTIKYSSAALQNTITVTDVNQLGWLER